jgi:hypothetical protein
VRESEVGIECVEGPKVVRSIVCGGQLVQVRNRGKFLRLGLGVKGIGVESLIMQLSMDHLLNCAAYRQACFYAAMYGSLKELIVGLYKGFCANE